jgi:hypothetical protein
MLNNANFICASHFLSFQISENQREKYHAPTTQFINQDYPIVNIFCTHPN